MGPDFVFSNIEENPIDFTLYLEDGFSWGKTILVKILHTLISFSQICIVVYENVIHDNVLNIKTNVRFNWNL